MKEPYRKPFSRDCAGSPDAHDNWIGGAAMTDTAKPDRVEVVAELIDVPMAKAFLAKAARYFESRPSNGEDSAHWANVYNAKNCRAIATRLTELEAERDRLKEAMAGDWSRIFPLAAEAAEEAGRQKATAEIVAWLDEQAAWHAKHDDGLSGFDRIAQGYLEAASGIRNGDHLTTGEAHG